MIVEGAEEVCVYTLRRDVVRTSAWGRYVGIRIYECGPLRQIDTENPSRCTYLTVIYYVVRKLSSFKVLRVISTIFIFNLKKKNASYAGTSLKNVYICMNWRSNDR